MTADVMDDVRGFWMDVALGLKDEMIVRGNRVDELDGLLRDQLVARVSIQALAYNALRTDGAHHKQWFLEQILQLVTEPKEYERVRVDSEWNPGIEP